MYIYAKEHSCSEDLWAPWKNVTLILFAFICLVLKVYLKGI